MHPVTPAIRGWKAFVAVLAIVSFQVSDNLQAAAELVDHHWWWYLLAVLAAVGLIGFGWASLAWRMTRFAVTDEAVHLRSGVVFRQQRQARLDRLQAVDVVQPLLARLVGLSELRLEVAGGAGSAVSLAFLRDDEAEELRAELLALAAGLRRPDTSPGSSAQESGAASSGPSEAPVAAGSIAPAGERGRTVGDVVPPGTAPDARPAGAAGRPSAFQTAPEVTVYEVPLGRLIGSVALSGGTFWLLVMAVAVVVLIVVTDEIGSAFVLVPALFGVVGSFWGRINGGASFRAATSPDGIRLRHGLTESRAQTVPPGRVQALRLHQGPLWRKADWWRVQINVAGYGSGSQETERESVLHPVATRDEAATAVWLVLPDLGVADPRAVLDAALTGRDDEGGFVPAPRRARWVDPIGWRRHGVLVTERALILRSGRWWRTVVVVPHERTQSLGLEQGPLQRALHVASFAAHSTPGPVTPRVSHLDEKVAAVLLAEQANRAREARARATPEQWMSQLSTAGLTPDPATTGVPTDPAAPVDPTLPVDPILPADPALPVDPAESAGPEVR